MLDPKCFWGERTCSRFSMSMLSLVGLRFHPLLRQPKTMSFLSLGLYVHHTCDITLVNNGLLNDNISVHDFVLKGFKYKYNFDTIGQWKVCSCASAFNFLHMLPNGYTTKHQRPKNGKTWDCQPHQCQRINRSRWNLIHKRRQWVYTSTLNLALISTGG